MSWSDLDKSGVAENEAIFVNALIQFLIVFSQEYIGSVEINYSKVFRYVQSGRFHWVTAYEIKCLDDALQFIEKQVITGFPIWYFLNLENDFQKSVFKDLERAYEQEQLRKREEKRLLKLKTYKCLTCKNYYLLETSFFIQSRCEYIERSSGINQECGELSQRLNYGNGFNPCTEEARFGCDKYIYDENKDK